MANTFLEDFNPGDRLTHVEMNAILAELRRQGKFASSGTVLVSDDQSGYAFSANLPADGFWIKLTSGGTGGKYAWTKVLPDGSGGWTTAPGNRSGTTSTDPAYEQNGNASITLTPNPVVRAWRDPAKNTVQFQRGAC